MRKQKLLIVGIAALVLGVIFIALAQVGLAHFILPDETVIWNIVRDLGTALAIAGFAVVSVERITSAHLTKETETFIEQLRTDLVQAMFGRQVDKQLSSEIARHIIEDDIVYRGFMLTKNLHTVKDDPDSLEGRSIAHFEVANVSGKNATWAYHMRMSDLASGRTPSPNAVESFTVKSEANPKNNIKLHAVELAPNLETDETLGTIELKREFILEPDEVLKVQVVRYVRVRARDTYTLTVRHPTIDGLGLEIHLPAGFKVDCAFAHPGQNDPAQCSFEVNARPGDSTVALASIQRGAPAVSGHSDKLGP